MGDVIKRVSLFNFRNYAGHDFEPDSDVTVLFGANGSGKTNLLEAVALAASGVSFRGARSSDLVSQGAEVGRVTLFLDKEGRERELEVIIPCSGMKRYRISGVPKRRGALVGELGVVLFLPEELELPYRSPSRRRGYLDRILSGLEIGYAPGLSRLERILEQRGRLLRRITEGLAREGELAVWDAQFVGVAAEVATRRFELIDRLAPLAAEEYAGLAPGGGVLRTGYASSVPRERYAERLTERLRETLSEQLRLRATISGPHRDDLVLGLEGSLLSERASRGEVRTAMLALKLAEMRLYEERFGERPLLLLDDVFSELDEARRKALVERLSGHQVIITTTDADHVDPALTGVAALYEVLEGGLRRVGATG